MTDRVWTITDAACREPIPQSTECMKEEKK